MLNYVNVLIYTKDLLKKMYTKEKIENGNFVL